MAPLGLEGLGDEKSFFLLSRKNFFVRALHTPTTIPMFTYTPLHMDIYIYVHIYVYIYIWQQPTLSKRSHFLRHTQHGCQMHSPLAECNSISERLVRLKINMQQGRRSERKRVPCLYLHEPGKAHRLPLKRGYGEFPEWGSTFRTRTTMFRGLDGAPRA